MMQMEKQEFNLDKPMHQTDIPQGGIKERHLGDNMKAIVFGLEADLPSGSSWTKCYFATDSNKLYIWNGSAWVSVTLS